MNSIIITKVFCGNCGSEISIDNLIPNPTDNGPEYYCPHCGSFVVYYEPPDKSVVIPPYPYND